MKNTKSRNVIYLELDNTAELLQNELDTIKKELNLKSNKKAVDHIIKNWRKIVRQNTFLSI